MSSLKIVIPILVVITIVVIIFNLTQNEIFDEQVTELENSSEIEGLLDKINSDKAKNDSSDNPYIPIEREWIASGPFKIDRSEYLLGEKIFVNIDALDVNEKGKVVFYIEWSKTVITDILESSVILFFAFPALK